MGAFSVIYNLPLFYQVVLNLSAAKAGIRLIPNSIGASVGSLGYGMLMARTVRLLSADLTVGPFLLAWDLGVHVPIYWYSTIIYLQYLHAVLAALYFGGPGWHRFWRIDHCVTDSSYIFSAT